MSFFGKIAIHIALLTTVEGLVRLLVDGFFKDKFDRVNMVVIVVLFVMIVLLNNVLVAVIAFMTMMLYWLLLDRNVVILRLVIIKFISIFD